VREEAESEEQEEGFPVCFGGRDSLFSTHQQHLPTAKDVEGEDETVDVEEDDEDEEEEDDEDDGFSKIKRLIDQKQLRQQNILSNGK
jgi:hypothetical protein